VHKDRNLGGTASRPCYCRGFPPTLTAGARERRETIIPQFPRGVCTIQCERAQKERDTQMASGWRMYFGHMTDTDDAAKANPKAENRIMKWNRLPCRQIAMDRINPKDTSIRSISKSITERGAGKSRKSKNVQKSTHSMRANLYPIHARLPPMGLPFRNVSVLE